MLHKGSMKEFEEPDYLHDMACTKILVWCSAGISLCVILFVLAMTFSSCTINMSNVSTHGNASDVVDDVTETKTDANLSIPAI